jgi:hypothetical protein
VAQASSVDGRPGADLAFGVPVLFAFWDRSMRGPGDRVARMLVRHPLIRGRSDGPISRRPAGRAVLFAIRQIKLNEIRLLPAPGNLR